ncbi:IclR family transcriptional regulator [Alcanivorax xiamenensis]|nr:IclR family transcriptional regulator [Alcanivorax xiamenensis]
MTDAKDTPPAPPTQRDENERSLPGGVISLRIIEALAGAEQSMGVTQVAKQLGMPKARVHRHLVGLRDHGYVTQTSPGNQYRIGWRLYLLGQQCVRQFDIVSLARPTMEALRDRTGQTVVIATFSEGEVVVLNLLRGHTALEIALRPGTRFNFNAVAQGKIVLAFGPKGLLEELLADPLPANTARTIVDPDRLRSEIDLVRRRGWADAPEELFTGVNALAAPLFQADGSLFGTLALVGSIHYLPLKPLADHVDQLLHASREVSSLLGHSID